MKKLMILIAMSVLMLPVLASATVVTDIVGTADCDGWETTITVHFRPDISMMDLVFSVALTDGSEVLYVFDYTGVIERPAGTTVGTYSFDGLWEGYFESPTFFAVENFAVFFTGEESPAAVGSLEIDMDCTVPVEESTWGHTKALYR